MPVLTLVLLIVLLWIILTVLPSAWTLWLQSYIYSEPTTGIEWRGPAAGSALAFFLLLWIILDYNSPGHFPSLFEITSTEDNKPFPELRIPTNRGEEVYRLRPGARLDYRLNGQANGKPLPSRPPHLIVLEDGEKIHFEPQRDAHGNFKTKSTSSVFGSSEEPLRYTDNKGRVMLENSLGQLSTFRGGRFVANVVINLLFLALWFVVLWLLLRFQWPHALGQAIVFWLVMLLFVMPPLLARAETVARQRAKAAGAGKTQAEGFSLCAQVVSPRLVPATKRCLCRFFTISS
jgi:hypothetical protein